MTPPKTELIAGLHLKVVGDLTPAEQVWITENAKAEQTAAAERKYKLVQELAELIDCDEYDALIIINSEPELRTVAARSALELMSMRRMRQDEKSPAEQPKDRDIEYLTFMINSRRIDGQTYTYEQVMSFSAEEKEAAFDFFAKEMGIEVSSKDPEEDPTGKSLDSSEPQVEKSPETSVITG
jgi:hypothetical protein